MRTKAHERKWSNGVDRSFSPAELRLFFSVIDNPRHLICFRLMRYLGLRVGEAVRVRLEDLTLDSADPRIAIVNRKTRGEGSPPEFLNLSDNLLGPLKEYVKDHATEIKAHGGYLIYSGTTKGHVKEDSMRAHFRFYIGKAGLDETYADIASVPGQPAKLGRRKLHRFTTHSLRHTYVTRAWNATHDLDVVRKLARHRSLSSIETYINTSAEKLREANALACQDETVAKKEEFPSDIMRIAKVLMELMEDPRRV